MNTTRIELTKGKFAIIDAEDEHLTVGRSWSIDGRGYAQGWMNGKVVKLHRVIVSAPPGQIVDHIDGDKMNCRRSNLRFATKGQNSANCKGRGTSSGYRGVFISKGKWQAKIGSRRVGTFDNPLDAAIARDNAMRAIYGSFARYNFPKEGELPA